MNRRSAAFSVLALWAAALGWLLYRQYGPRKAALLAEAALSLPPGATYYALSLGGQQIGFASNTVDTLADTIRVTDIMVLDIPALGQVRRTEARTDAVLSRTLRLREFRAWLRGDLGDFAARGTVSGDSLLLVELETGGTVQTVRVRLERPIVLAALLPLQVAFGERPRPGRTYTLRLFDPLLLNEREVSIRVTGDSTFLVPDSARFDPAEQRWVAARWDTVPAIRVSQEIAGVELEAWIDYEGRIVRANSPVGFVMERSAFELVHENFRRRGAAPVALGGTDLIRQTAIASNVRLSPSRLRQLRVRLKGVDLSGFDLEGDRQRLSGDTLIVTVEDPERLRANYRLPSTDPNFEREISPEPLIQSRDPRIQAQARQIVGRVRDPRRAAELLNDWVYRNLEKEIAVSVPSAVQVLESRKGDCNEHTVLYVALARALGLPARTAAGLVYVDGRFYYHAWPEVYLDGWVAVDPTFGQFPADAAHLRFTVGGLARQVELVRLIGRIELEVLN
jgi:transglutaminase-like putative cysteine protease